MDPVDGTPKEAADEAAAWLTMEEALAYFNERDENGVFAENQGLLKIMLPIFCVDEESDMSRLQKMRNTTKFFDEKGHRNGRI